MSGLLKAKIALITLSVPLLILVPLVDNSFYAEITINRWRQLTWDDFNGTVLPFSGWAAVISSNVYMEYDSISEAYEAYAGQNDRYSWVSARTRHSDYALNHEQYHFNLSEYHAQLMNLWIESNPEAAYDEMVSQLNIVRRDLDVMQDQYDTQCEHGVLKDMQRLWEYRIDSLLQSTTADTLGVLDSLTGASAFFPRPPKLYEGINANNAYRYYFLPDYDMELSISTFQYDVYVEGLRENLRIYYEKDTLEILSYEFDSLSGTDIHCQVSYRDTASNLAAVNAWHFNGDFMYKMIAEYPLGTGTDSGYLRIANSFLSSFQANDVDAIWSDQFESEPRTIIHSSANDLKASETSPSNKCASYGSPGQYGFHGKPIITYEGDLIIPYRILEHPDSLIQEVMIIHNNQWFTMEKTSETQLFFVPREKLDFTHDPLRFGYLLKEDTSARCFQFYHQALMSL